MNGIQRLKQTLTVHLRFRARGIPGCRPEARDLSDHMKRDIGWYNKTTVRTADSSPPTVVRDYILRTQM